MTIKTIGRGDHYISSDYLILLAEIAFEHGIAASELFADTGLDEALLLQPNTPVGHESGLSFVERFCQLTDDITVAIEFGKRMTLSKHGVLGYAAQYSETMVDAGDKMTRFMETRAQLFRMEKASDDQVRRLIITPRFASEKAVPFLILAFLTSIETICRTLLGERGKSTPSEIRIALGQPCPELENQNWLPNCRIKITDENMLRWPADSFFSQLPFFNPQMESVTEKKLQKILSLVKEPDSLTEKVEQLLRQDLTRLPTTETMAERLHMSAATLNRKLKAEGISFQQVKDKVRFEQAKELLNQDISLDAVAAQLGYSDASNFTKAFKNWAGQSPAQYRNK